jgi:tagatose 6-phosphate kinase
VIITVTANGSVERTMSTSGLTTSGVFRAHNVVLLASGKGTNAARAAHILGHPVICTGFIAGHSGRLLAQLASEEGLPSRWTAIDGETRAAVIIVDDQTPGQDAFLISEPGMSTTAADWQRLKDDVLAVADFNGGIVCLAGSVPPGTPLKAYSELVTTLQNRGHKVWVDVEVPALSAALVARPAGIKINRNETDNLLGQTPENIPEIVEAAQAIRAKGAGTVIITLGKAGAVFVDGQQAWLVQPPNVSAISTVGSGDAFLGGLAVGLAREEPVAEILRRAAAAGAANTLQIGGGRLRLADYEKLLPQVQVKPLPLSKSH